MEWQLGGRSLSHDEICDLRSFGLGLLADWQGQFHHHFFSRWQLGVVVTRARFFSFSCSQTFTFIIPRILLSATPIRQLSLNIPQPTNRRIYIKPTPLLTAIANTPYTKTSKKRHKEERWQEGAQRIRWRPRQRTTPSASNSSAPSSPIAPVGLGASALSSLGVDSLLRDTSACGCGPRDKMHYISETPSGSYEVATDKHFHSSKSHRLVDESVIY